MKLYNEKLYYVIIKVKYLSIFIDGTFYIPYIYLSRNLDIYVVFLLL